MPEKLEINDDTIKALSEKYGTPLQLYDESLIEKRAKYLLSTFREKFPSFTNFFAVKALPNPAILKVILDAGHGFDCSSEAELDVVKSLGVPSEKILFTSNFTSKKDLVKAFDMKVILNLDDHSLLDNLLSANGNTAPELISFRVNPGIGRSDSGTSSNVLGGPDAKFGVDVKEVLLAYEKAKKAGVKRYGIHMMTGSCVLCDDYWVEAVGIITGLAAQLKKDLGIDMEFINIGGGLGVQYRPNEPQVDLPVTVARIRSVFEKHYGSDLSGMPKLYMENGRYVTGPFGWLIAQCQAVKRNSNGIYYGLDACMANLMRPGMYGAYHHISIVGKGDENLEEANVVGTLCENNDWFAKARKLPRAEIGDLFVIYDTGAHSHSMGFQYNGKLRAPEVLLRKDGSESLIRKRENYDSLFGNTVLPKDL